MKRWRNKIIQADCRDAFELLGDLHEQIKTIYIDPPFLTGTNYTLKNKSGGSHSRAPELTEIHTYSDKWKKGIEEYLEFLRSCIEPMHKFLRSDGSLWLHLDTHSSHYAKVMIDQIFGRNNFINEIIWKRTNSPKAQSNGFGTQHDIILLYAKDASKFRVKPVYRKHDDKSLRPYRYSDERGRFRLIEIEAQGIQRTAKRKQYEWRGRIAPYLYKRETLDQWWEEGLIYKSRNGRYSKKQYLDDVKGVLVSDLWLDISPVQGNSSEYVGFTTQKPLTLLERVIKSSTDKEDIVADFFAGSGTTAIAAQKLNRRWIICDISSIAIDVFRRRLRRVCNIEETEFIRIE